MKSCEDIPSRSKARIPWWYPEKWEKLGNVELSCFKGHRGQRRKGRLSRRCRVSKRVGHREREPLGKNIHMSRTSHFKTRSKLVKLRDSNGAIKTHKYP